MGSISTAGTPQSSKTVLIHNSARAYAGPLYAHPLAISSYTHCSSNVGHDRFLKGNMLKNDKVNEGSRLLCSQLYTRGFQGNRLSLQLC